MPATAGRVRMPANNRVHSSAALQTHGIWQSAIGYDPYAPTNKDDGKKSTHKASNSAELEPEREPENAYASFQGLLALARRTNSNSDEARGSCKKCGRVGHLTFQCRNFLSVKEEVSKVGKDDDVIREVVLEKLKGGKVKSIAKKSGLESWESSDDEEEEDSESSDSDYDSEMERMIAGKYGKKASGKVMVASRKDDEDERERRNKSGRSKKRRSGKRENSDSEDECEGRRRKRMRRMMMMSLLTMKKSGGGERGRAGRRGGKGGAIDIHLIIRMLLLRILVIDDARGGAGEQLPHLILMMLELERTGSGLREERAGRVATKTRTSWSVEGNMSRTHLVASPFD